MSVVGTARMAKIDPIKGQPYLMRWLGYAEASGDASGGYANPNIFLPASSFEHPFWILKGLNTYVSGDTGGDGQLVVQNYDLGFGTINNQYWFVDMILNSAGPLGNIMLPGVGIVPLLVQLQSYVWRYNSSPTAGVYPTISFYHPNVNLLTYIASAWGYFIDEKYLPMITPTLLT